MGLGATNDKGPKGAKKSRLEASKGERTQEEKIKNSYLSGHGFVDGSPPRKSQSDIVVRLMMQVRMWQKDESGTYQMSFSELGSFTIRLSMGDLPVFLPEYAVKAPDEVIAVPVSYT
jgi:hypothetical protein